MKSIKHSIVFSFIFLLIFSMPLLSEKRDLSTPASRLVGHWEDSDNIQYYFGPLDSNTKKGLIICVIPDSRKLFKEWIAQYRSNRYAVGWSEDIDKKLDVAYFSERYGKKTSYCQYEVLSQGLAQIHIKLVPDFYNSAGGTFRIDKNGKTMKQGIMDVPVEGIGPVAGPYLFWGETLKYIDSKISPEDIATSISPEKRNLSTPLTRLVGHWKAYQGSHFYFSTVDPSTMIGSFIHIYPEFTREMFEKFKTKLNHVKDLSNRKRKKLIKIYFETAKQFSSSAVNCKYRIFAQKRNGERIEIDITCENSYVMRWGGEIFHIEKNGKFMTDYERLVFDFYPELLEQQEIDKQDIIRFLVLPAQTPYEKKERRFIYIDSNTSPEDKK